MSAQPERNTALADSLTRELSHVTTPADSLGLLTDIFDLRPRKMRDSIGNIILNTAINAGNDDVALDALRNLANLHFRNDSLLQRDMRFIHQFKDSEDKSETRAFIQMMMNMQKVRYSTPQENERQLRDLLRKAHDSKHDNIYDDIVLLHGICLYISQYSHGELLVKYMTRLENLIDKLRPEAYSLRNCYYILAAMCYSDSGNYEKSLTSDKKLLKSIEDLEKGALGRGRHYRSYDANRYIVYTRMLSNYPFLSDREVEEYFNEAMLIVKNDSLAASTNRISMRPQIYYALFKGRHAEALDLLKNYIDAPYNAPGRTNLLKLMIECADSVGDKEALLWASREYNTRMEQLLDERTNEKSKELQIVYDINQMKADYAHKSLRMQRIIMIVALTASAILLILLVGMILLWRHTKGLAANLKKSNQALTAESYNLRLTQRDLVKARDEARLADRVKSDFIRNMSTEVSVPLHTINEYTNLIIDCSESAMKPYLKNFADLVALNAELLTSIVNDVLNLSEIDSNGVSISMKKESLLPLCKMAVESIRHRVNKNVKIDIDPDLQDITVNTDVSRFMQVLVHLLSNAAKFTKEGNIEVSYHPDEERKNVIISVTDTGIGVPDGNSERIFERFVKLDKTSQGVGIGLSIARHFAHLLGGNVELDTSYSDGARFLFTIPMA